MAINAAELRSTPSEIKLVHTKAPSMRQRLQKAAELRGAGLEPFAYGFSATHSAQALAAEYSSLADGEEDLASTMMAVAQ